MQDYFFGTMDEFIEVGYAPTGRAACRRCKGKIEKGMVRVGECIQSDHFNSRLWHHLICFRLKPLFRAIRPDRQIYRLDDLEEEDRQAVLAHFEQEAERLNEGRGKGKGRSPKKAKSRPSKAKQEKEEKEEQIQEKPASKRVTRSSSRPKPIAKLGKREPSPSPPPKKERAKKNASLSTKGSAKRKAKTAKHEQAYSSQQKEKLKELLAKYMQMPTDKLKEILSVNGQTKVGKKPELAEKCADGELLGRIPQCTSCGGGKLRFMPKASLYKCPGFMDDDEFRNCNRYFTMAEIVREPWLQL